MNTLKKSTDLESEYETSERCHIIELLNQDDDRSQSIARARVEPGITTVWHHLTDTSEVYYILSGKGRAEVGDKSYELKAHELLRIPAHTRQRITNTGQDDLVFLCFCVPAFSMSAYKDLES